MDGIPPNIALTSCESRIGPPGWSVLSISSLNIYPQFHTSFLNWSTLKYKYWKSKFPALDLMRHPTNLQHHSSTICALLPLKRLPDRNGRVQQDKKSLFILAKFSFGVPSLTRSNWKNWLSVIKQKLKAVATGFDIVRLATERQPARKNPVPPISQVFLDTDNQIIMYCTWRMVWSIPT